MQILLIDDDPISVFLTEQLFKRNGPGDTLTSFLSPLEALAFLRQQLQTSSPPHIILLDLNMPLLSGWDFLDALQPYESQLRHQSDLYILTSSLAPVDTVKAHQYPLVAGLLHKPLDISAIHAIRARGLEQLSRH